jgi:hypothetical protein
VSRMAGGPTTSGQRLVARGAGASRGSSEQKLF